MISYVIAVKKRIIIVHIRQILPKNCVILNQTVLKGRKIGGINKNIGERVATNIDGTVIVVGDKAAVFVFDSDNNLIKKQTLKLIILNTSYKVGWL